MVRHRFASAVADRYTRENHLRYADIETRMDAHTASLSDSAPLHSLSSQPQAAVRSQQTSTSLPRAHSATAPNLSL